MPDRGTWAWADIKVHSQMPITDVSSDLETGTEKSDSTVWSCVICTYEMYFLY